MRRLTDAELIAALRRRPYDRAAREAAQRLEELTRSNAMDQVFWEACIKAGCIIAPVRLYSDWGEDGNIDEAKLIGLRFVAVPCDNSSVVASDGAYFMLDEQVTGAERYHETPQEALDAFARG